MKFEVKKEKYLWMHCNQNDRVWFNVCRSWAYFLPVFLFVWLSFWLYFVFAMVLSGCFRFENKLRVEMVGCIIFRERGVVRSFALLYKYIGNLNGHSKTEERKWDVPSKRQINSKLIYKIIIYSENTCLIFFL